MFFNKCRDCKFLNVQSSATKCKKHNKIISIDDYACGDFQNARGFFDFGNTCRECVFFDEKLFGGAQCLKGYWGKKPDDVACGKFKRK